MELNFCGVILGGDVNSYAVARAFYEEYKIKTIVIGIRPMYPTICSKLIAGYYYKDLLQDEVLVKALTELDNIYPDKKKILLGNTDYYVKHVLNNRKSIEKISSNYIIPMTSLKQFEQLVNKKSFYELCDKYGLDHPKTLVFDFKKDDIKKFKIGFIVYFSDSQNDNGHYNKYEYVKI